MSCIGLSVNGEDVPFQLIQLSLGANTGYVKAFSTLFSGTGKMYYNSGNISREEFLLDYVIYAYGLTADMCGSSPHFNTDQRGNLALDLKFSTAPTTAVSLVCYEEFENLIQIDAETNVIYNYSS